MTTSFMAPKGATPALAGHTVLSIRAGLHEQKVGRIIRGEFTTLSWGEVDRLFCAMDMPRWGIGIDEPDHPLLPWYWQGTLEIPPDPSRPFKCEYRYCEGDGWFAVEPFKDGRIDPNRQKFCTRLCWRKDRELNAWRYENDNVRCAFPECGKMYARYRVSQKYCKRTCKQNHYNRLKGVPRAHRRNDGEKTTTRQAA